MTVLKRGNYYWIDFGFNHHRYRRRSPHNSYKGAQAYELTIRQKLTRGETLEETKPVTRYTFKEVALQWLDSYVKNNNKPSEFINRGYILNANLIPHFGDFDIDEINSYSIEQYKNRLLKEAKLSTKSINNQLCILSRCLKTAVEWGMMKEIPKIKLLKVPPQKYDYLNETETLQLLQNAEGQWYDLILLALQTGMRFGELIALRWEDINIVEKFLTVNKSIVRKIEGSPKNNKPRTIPLTQSVSEMLYKRIRDSQYVFHDATGSPLTYDVCRHALHVICLKASLRKINWHVLRHSFASHLAAKRNSIIAIKELMGHADVKTTMRYTHVNLPVLQNAINTLEPVLSIQRHNSVTNYTE